MPVNCQLYIFTTLLISKQIRWKYSFSISCFDNPSGRRLPPWVSSITLIHSGSLLWTNDRFVAHTSSWQGITLTRDKHPRPGGIRTCNPSRRATVEPRFGPRVHWVHQIQIQSTKTRNGSRRCSHPALPQVHFRFWQSVRSQQSVGNTSRHMWSEIRQQSYNNHF